MSKELNNIYKGVFIAAELLEKKSPIRLRQPEIAVWQYGRGGETIHRGYYCPSLIYDIVVGGANRGKLLKRLKNPATYVYGFDESGNLVSVKNNDSGTEECIWRNGDLELGVTFDTSWVDTERIICISVVERHCGSIRSYVCCDCAADTQKIVNVYGEVYEYQCDRLCKVFCCRSIGSGFFYDRETRAHWENQLHCFLIEFEHDGSGYLKSYQMTDLRSSVTQMFPVLLKRRV